MNTDFVNNLADALNSSMPEVPTAVVGNRSSQEARLDASLELGQWRVDIQAIADALRAVVPGPRLGTTGAGFDRSEFLDRCYGRGSS